MEELMNLRSALALFASRMKSDFPQLALDAIDLSERIERDLGASAVADIRSAAESALAIKAKS